jgi:hypothetical protein
MGTRDEPNPTANPPPEVARLEPKASFRSRLETLINECSAENESDTPDFILADYLNGCLAAFNLATVRRENWYGRQRGVARGEPPSDQSESNQPETVPASRTFEA